MRTTITLDPDVEVLVRRAMNERGLSFKDAVNDALRSALTSDRKRRPARTRSYAMGEARFPIEHALRIAGELEDEEILRKMQLGK